MRTAPITFAADTGMADRIGLLASAACITQAEWLRLAVILTDSLVVLDEVGRQAQHAPLSERAQVARDEAAQTVEAVRQRLAPVDAHANRN